VSSSSQRLRDPGWSGDCWFKLKLRKFQSTPAGNDLVDRLRLAGVTGHSYSLVEMQSGQASVIFSRSNTLNFPVWSSGNCFSTPSFPTITAPLNWPKGS
jgi:hypothetical protein